MGQHEREEHEKFIASEYVTYFDAQGFAMAKVAGSQYQYAVYEDVVGKKFHTYQHTFVKAAFPIMIFGSSALDCARIAWEADRKVLEEVS
jgi:hypothetical protein